MPIYGRPPLRSDIGGLSPVVIPVNQARIVTQLPQLAAYSLTADAGSFALTGGTAAPFAGRRLIATGTSYTLSGSATGLLGARRLTAAAGSFTLSGTATGTLLGHKLLASAGSFALSGAAAGFGAARRITAALGSLTLTGAAATLTFTAVPTSRQYALGGLFPLYLDDRSVRQAAVAGVYVNQTFQGAAQSYSLTASAGTFALTGATAGFAKGSGAALTAATGAFVVAGASATFARTYVLPAVTGAFVASGASATFTRTYVLSAAAGTFALTGGAAAVGVSGTRSTQRQYALGGLLPAYVNETGSRDYAVAGAFLSETSSAIALSLTADGGVFSLTGSSANFIISRPITVILGGGRAAIEPLRHYRLQASAGRFALVANDARLLVGRCLGVEPGPFDLVPGDADLTAQLFDWVGNDNDFLLLAA